MNYRHVPNDKTFDPDALMMISNVFDKICQSRQIRPNSDEAEALARRLFSLAQHGIRDAIKLETMAAP